MKVLDKWKFEEINIFGMGKPNETFAQRAKTPQMSGASL